MTALFTFCYADILLQVVSMFTDFPSCWCGLEPGMFGGLHRVENDHLALPHDEAFFYLVWERSLAAIPPTSGTLKWKD